MITVWVLVEEDYEDYDIKGIFATEELANEFYDAAKAKARKQKKAQPWWGCYEVDGYGLARYNA